MKILFTLVFGSLLFVANAQISIVSSDMPKANDTMRYSQAIGGISALQADKTGTDTLWDFSNLKPSSQDVEKFYAPSATPYVLQFGLLNAATYGIKDNAFSNFSQFGGNLGVSVENVYAFYKNSTSASVIVGRGATVSGIPLGLNLNPRDTIFKFPLNYGDLDSSFFKGSVNIPSLGGLIQQGSRVTKVDGWGKVKTPYGIFDCIRIKATVMETDSIQISTFRIPVQNNRIIYTWYAKNERYPILEVTVPMNLLGQGIITIKYKDIYRAEAFASAARFTANPLKAVNTDTVSFINQSVGSPKSFEWTITPTSFRFVGGTTANSASPKVMFNEAGIYSAKLKVIYEGGFDDTLRSDYINVSVLGTSIKNEVLIGNDFEVYPNPAMGSFEIKSYSNFNDVNVDLIDVMGKIMFSKKIELMTQNGINFNVNELKSGIYFLNITTKSGVKFHKKMRIN